MELNSSAEDTILSVEDENQCFYSMFSQEYVKNILTQYEKLNALFSKVKIEYIQGEPVTKIVDGQMIIEDSSTSEIKMTDAQLAEITALVETVRTDLLK